MAAALRCLMTKLPRTAEIFAAPGAAVLQIQTRKNHIKWSSLKIEDLDPSKLTDFEISKNPEEWKYVERLLPIQTVPEPKKFDGPTPSGWVPPREEGKTHPYFVPRNKNHMLQVYLHISYRGSKHVTIIRKVQGDIWKMEEELRKYLESKSTKYYKSVAGRVNEMSGQIHFKGDHVARVKEWMEMKGF